MLLKTDSLKCLKVFVLCIILFNILHSYSQEDKILYPDIAFNPETSDGTKKAAEATQAYSGLSPWNGSYNSDYYIHFQWNGFYFQCDCSNYKYTVQITIGGKVYNAGTHAGSSYSGYACRVGLGPSQSGSARQKSSEGGKHDKVLICLTNCTAYWQSSGDMYYWTAAIRPPVSPLATQAEYDYRIDLSWEKSTDIPNANHGYLIKRNGEEIAQVYNGQKTYSDNDLGPAETHVYTIHTIWPGNENYTHISEGVDVTGRTFDLNLTASADRPVSINLKWNSIDSIPGKENNELEYYKIDRYDEYQGDLITFPQDISKDNNNYSDESASLVPGYLYRYTLTPYPQIAFYPDTAWGKRMPNGVFRGKVLSPTGHGVRGAKVCAIRQNPVPQDTTTTYCAITDSTGSFEIRNIYYFLESDFKIVPEKDDHGFDPATQQRTLTLYTHLQDGTVFTDTSAFTVSGRVVQKGNHGDCPVSGVEIFVNKAEEPESITDHDGFFAFSVGQMGNYTIKPVLNGHGFSPPAHQVFIDSDTIIPSFLDTTLHTLTGTVGAPCNNFIGRALLGITSGYSDSYCFDTTVMTDLLTGYYEIELPARKYEINLLEFFSENPDVENDQVESYFTGMEADLTFEDLNLDLIYRSAPQLMVSGFTDYGCGDYAGIPIIRQGYEYIIDIELLEVFGDHICTADTGFVIVQNRAGFISEKYDTLYLSNGKGQYTFIPGDPNLISPHLRNLTFTAWLGNESVIKSMDVLVIGNKPREQTYTTVSPEIPFIILRDPPGDASYSYLEERTTSQTSMRLSAQTAGSVNVWREVKAGAKFQAGFGVTVETSIWGKVKGSLEVGASVTAQDEFTLSITNMEQFSTSGNPDVTGADGDVFAGSALNLIYALTDVIDFNPSTCTVEKSVSLSMGVDGFATTFIYTDNHIRNVLIPQLTYIRNLYLSNNNDSAHIYADQIDLWQQTLKLNEDLKAKSIYIENPNRSFSASAPYHSSQEIAITKSSYMEFSVYIESSIAAEAGIEIGGVGASGGVEVKLRTGFGVSSTQTDMASKLTGYFLSDNNPGDYFSVDILRDEVYGTPVFKTVGGASSCPWEKGTQPREGVQIIAEKYVAHVDDPDGQAVFRLQLANNSQSDEDRFYNLWFDQASNPDGAEITLGGSQVQGGIATPYFIQAGKYLESTVTLTRGPEAFDYENIRFILASGCGDPAIEDTLHLSAHFKGTCSDISIIQPSETWAVSSNDNNRLKLRLGNYDRDLLDLIRIQVKNTGIYNWLTVKDFSKDDLGPSFTDITVLLDEFIDGNYDVRAVLECAGGKKYSQLYSGTIDRHGPVLFGLPEPSDLILKPGELIMALFDEDVNCILFNSDVVTVTNLSTREIMEVEVGCFGNMVIIIPDLEGKYTEGDTFNIKITHLEDMAGNNISSPVSWSFVIFEDPTPQADADTDNDSISNHIDNCSWTYNPDQADMNADGIGDVCDDDIDGDGIANHLDNCPWVNNPGQEDSNGDGIGDACIQWVGIVKPTAPEGFQFLENFPNPFRENTTITYILPEESHVVMKVYNIMGRELEVLTNQAKPPGTWSITWDASNFNDGVFFCTIYAKPTGSNEIVTKTIKMVKIK